METEPGTSTNYFTLMDGGNPVEHEILDQEEASGPTSEELTLTPTLSSPPARILYTVTPFKDPSIVPAKPNSPHHDTLCSEATQKSLSLFHKWTLFHETIQKDNAKAIEAKGYDFQSKRDRSQSLPILPLLLEGIKSEPLEDQEEGSGASSGLPMDSVEDHQGAGSGSGAVFEISSSSPLMSQIQESTIQIFHEGPEDMDTSVVSSSSMTPVILETMGRMPETRILEDLKIKVEGQDDGFYSSTESGFTSECESNSFESLQDIFSFKCLMSSMSSTSEPINIPFPRRPCSRRSSKGQGQGQSGSSPFQIQKTIKRRESLPVLSRRSSLIHQNLRHQMVRHASDQAQGQHPTASGHSHGFHHRHSVPSLPLMSPTTSTPYGLNYPSFYYGMGTQGHGAQPQLFSPHHQHPLGQNSNFGPMTPLGPSSFLDGPTPSPPMYYVGLYQPPPQHLVYNVFPNYPNFYTTSPLHHPMTSNLSLAEGMGPPPPPALTPSIPMTLGSAGGFETLSPSTLHHSVYP